MNVFFAGATGVIGRQLLPLLVRAGHEVTAMTRSPSRVEQIRSQGARPVACNVFDQDGLRDAVVASKPDVLIHQLTDIPRRIHPRRVKTAMAATDRLRTEGTKALLQAAKAARTRRLIAQSIAFLYRPVGSALATEDEPLYHDAPTAFAGMVRAVDECERIVLGDAEIEGIVLRYGYFYGSGTIYARGGSFAEDVQRRRVPIVGDGSGMFSFIHVGDAAAATSAALEQGSTGTYNIVDDGPVALREWLPEYAQMLGAQSPFTVPKIIGRFAGGSYGIYLMTQQRGAANEKARRQLGWEPGYSTWREGFHAELAASG